MDIMVAPCKLPCKHVFCYDCLLAVIDNKPKCPVCRNPIDQKTFKPKVDKTIYRQIKKQTGDAFEKKQKEMIGELLNPNRKVKISFEIGNLHEKVENKLHPHRWTMFVKACDEFEGHES